MKETQPKFLEKVGEYSRNGGIVAGIIGLLTSWEILTVGLIVAGSGEVLRRIGRGRNEQSRS